MVNIKSDEDKYLDLLNIALDKLAKGIKLDATSSAIIERIVRRLSKRGLSQRKMAEIFKTNTMTINRLLNDKY